jgi:type IV pilus modification protein PilV
MKRRRGYTLVEALVALVLLTAGVLAAAVTVLQALRHERAAAERAAALRAVASLAEDLRACPRPDGRALLAATGIEAAAACADHPPSCPAEACAARALAAALAAADTALPDGATLSVEAPVAARPSYRIELRWPAGDAEPARLRLAVDT